MSERVDRDALIARIVIAGDVSEWHAALILDEVVPLIAGALAAEMGAREAKANIETDQKRAEQFESEADGLLCAAALVRSLGGVG
jgi:hypothetical protein